MPRKARRTPKRRGPDVSEAVMYALEQGHIPPREERREYEGSHIEGFNLCYPSGHRLSRLREVWALIRDDVLRRWARERPGEIPWAERTLDKLGHEQEEEATHGFDEAWSD